MLDYIGSVRVPLSEFLHKESIESSFPVINQNNQQMGECQIRIQYADAYYIQSQDHKSQEALQSTIIE